MSGAPFSLMRRCQELLLVLEEMSRAMSSDVKTLYMFMNWICLNQTIPEITRHFRTFPDIPLDFTGHFFGFYRTFPYITSIAAC